MRLLPGNQAKQNDRREEIHMNIVIIGGVAGGMSAATRARRMNEQAKITVVERGGYISFANCGLPYYLAGRIKTRDKLLVTTAAAVKKRFNIDALTRHEAVRIDREKRQAEVRDLETGRTLALPYDKLIIATGASAIVPPIEHVRSPNVFLLRSMEDTLATEAWLKERQPKRVAIVGAGFIGLEMAEAMKDLGLEVTVIEKAPHALPPVDAEMAQMVHEELAKNGVKLITGVGMASLRAENGLVTGVGLENGEIVDADMVLLSIGVRPNTRLATEAGLKLGASGGIEVDASQRTSDPDIYAVGDVTEVLHGVTTKSVRVPLAGPANRQGRTAGEHAATGSAPPSAKVMGTAIVQVFGLSIGVTGLSERDAKRNGLEVDTAYVLPNHHAGYYPGAQPMRLKLIYEKPTGRIIGAQAAGGEGVDKRLDVIATAMLFKGTVDDLAEVDLAYAPQFGSAKDPVHMAAFVAQNQRRGVTSALSLDEVNGEFLVDVRTPEEYARGTLPGAINIPVDDLRTRLGELDPKRPTVVFCQVGLRGYIAQRILRQSGFENVRNLKGGWSLARLVQAS
jgi:NADPH-dependent 2,4-dienoyl-CoA reductase/sulfur reductase-like enzyme/rhodanese-related sulfurtransferase